MRPFRPVPSSRRDFLRQLTATSAMAGLLGPGLFTAQAGSRSPLAATRSGRIAGTVDRGIHVFRGVPYGADTATRRFQRSVRETAWTGARDATRFGASAPQRGDADGQSVSEDCLFLNVYTPALRDDGKRPILFYIHGGGYNNGSGSHPLYDGVNLCRRGDVVVVTVNHRLNAFGYLYLPALACIASASVLTAPLGARTAHRMDVRRLRRVFAALLYALAGYMLYKGLA